MIQRYLKILSYGIKLSKLYLVLRIFQLILSSASSAFSLLLPKMLLNAIATKNLKTVLIILSLSFFVSTINSLIDRFLSPKLSWLREKINAKIVDNFLQKSINLDLEYFDQPDAYDKYTIAFERCCAIVQGAFDILLSFISSLLQIGLVVYVLSWISPVVLLVFLTVCALQTYINNLIQLDNYKYQKFMNQHNRKLNYLYRLFYIPEFMRDIRANDIMRFIFTKKQKVTEKVLSDTYSTNQKVSTKNLTGKRRVLSLHPEYQPSSPHYRTRHCHNKSIRKRTRLWTSQRMPYPGRSSRRICIQLRRRLVSVRSGNPQQIRNISTTRWFREV